MKQQHIFFGLTSIILSLFTSTVFAANESMKCESGPLLRNFGKTAWNVYGCTDGKSLLVLSAQGNPAMPFYFMLFPKDGTYQLLGEGTGKKEYTAAAYHELEKLSAAEILKLYQQAKLAKK